MNNIFEHISDKSLYTTFDPTGTEWPDNVTNVQQAVSLISDYCRTDVGLPTSSTTRQGVIRCSTVDQTTEGTLTDVAVTPSSLHGFLFNMAPTETTPGVIQLATVDEAKAGIEPSKAITPHSLRAVLDVQATELKSSGMKLSSLAAAQGGVDDTTAMTPAKVKAAIAQFTVVPPEIADASETIRGYVQLATSAQASEGTLRVGYAISPYVYARANASTTKYGTTKLYDNTDSTSTALAATANSVKKTWDLATSKTTLAEVTSQFVKLNTVSIENRPNLIPQRDAGGYIDCGVRLDSYSSARMSGGLIYANSDRKLKLCTSPSGVKNWLGLGSGVLGPEQWSALVTSPLQSVPYGCVMTGMQVYTTH